MPWLVILIDKIMQLGVDPHRPEKITLGFRWETVEDVEELLILIRQGRAFFTRVQIVH